MHRGVPGGLGIFGFGGGRRVTAFGEPIAPRLVQHLFWFSSAIANIEKLDYGYFIDEKIEELYYIKLVP